MTQERIQTRYTLNGTLASHAELEQAIARAIETHKQDFFPLLERLVDVDDSRVKLSQKDPLRVLGVELDGAHTGGSARLSYESNFAESCRLIDEYDQHQTSVAFRLDGDQLIFDLELPIQWNFDNQGYSPAFAQHPAHHKKGALPAPFSLIHRIKRIVPPSASPLR